MSDGQIKFLYENDERRFFNDLSGWSRFVISRNKKEIQIKFVCLPHPHHWINSIGICEILRFRISSCASSFGLPKKVSTTKCHPLRWLLRSLLCVLLAAAKPHVWYSVRPLSSHIFLVVHVGRSEAPGRGIEAERGLHCSWRGIRARGCMALELLSRVWLPYALRRLILPITDFEVVRTATNRSAT